MPAAPYDVCIVGAGPGGISASLRAIELGLRYVAIKQDEFGGTVAKYPRRKLVLTSPVELPLHGRLNKLEISKEELLRLWATLQRETGLAIHTNERVDAVTRDPDGAFAIKTSRGSYRALAVILALGRRGTPRKLVVEGERLPKVMYDLIETEAYSNARILIVGGGDSAVEAALGLAHQPADEMRVSYRRDQFARIKDRNAQRLAESVTRKRLHVVFNSEVTRIGEQSVRLAIGTETREVPIDFVWVFARRDPPKGTPRAGGHRLWKPRSDGRRGRRSATRTSKRRGGPTLLGAGRAPHPSGPRVRGRQRSA